MQDSFNAAVLVSIFELKSSAFLTSNINLFRNDYLNYAVVIVFGVYYNIFGNISNSWNERVGQI